MKDIIKKTIKLFLRFMIWTCKKVLPYRLLILLKEEARYVKLDNIYGSLVTGIKGTIRPIEKGITPCFTEQIHTSETVLITRIIESFCDAKKKQKEVEKFYMPAFGWESLLKNEWMEYYDAIERKDIGAITILLRNFFRNGGISGFWGNGKMFNDFCYQDNFLAVMRADIMVKNFKIWRNLCPASKLTDLEAPKIGNPWGYIIDGVLLYEPVFEYHFQAQYFIQMLAMIKTPVILEIGGGFGGLAYHILKSSTSIKYIGFDLPENILLQAYYLSCAFPKARVLLYDSNFDKLDLKTLDSYDIVLLPNFTLPDVESSIADLVVNVRSLSEMSFETIVAYLREIDRIGHLFFFHENIYKPRLDGLFGIPTNLFPPLSNFYMISIIESRWPKYQSDSGYPCQETLLIHKNVISQTSSK